MKVGDLVSCTLDPDDVGIITDFFDECASEKSPNRIFVIKWSKFRMDTQEEAVGLNLLSAC